MHRQAEWHLGTPVTFKHHPQVISNDSNVEYSERIEDGDQDQGVVSHLVDVKLHTGCIITVRQGVNTGPLDGIIAPLVAREWWQRHQIWISDKYIGWYFSK